MRVLYGMESGVAAAALIMTAPLAVLIGLILFAISGRGPLVRHLRTGWCGAPLPMLKFRTMWDEAPARGTRLFEIEDVSGNVPEFKGGRDPRVRSRFAAFCRRYSLDEIPQLLHVARGEMSLVGPRPMTPEELSKYYRDCADEVLAVRPGMTGLWQVMGRNRLDYTRRKRLDLLLARRFSGRLYLRILLRSIPVVLSGKGAW